MNDLNFSPSNMEERISWLQLVRTKGIGKQILQYLLSSYGAPQAIVQNFNQDSKLRKFSLTSRALIEEELRQTENFGARIMLACDADFPLSLSVLDDCPLTLTIKGNESLLSKPNIAVVGARNASAAGLQLSASFARQLAANNIVVTSGLARGIDGAAHHAALAYNNTIAIIAGGINHIYPREHMQLFTQISEKGLLIAEAPFGNTPKAQQFPQRNRLISGVSMGVLVIEAGMRSGSLSTANFALQHGRELLVVPGSPLDPRCHGCNFLIKNGAHLVENIADIISAVPGLSMIKVKKEDETSFHDNNKKNDICLSKLALQTKGLLGAQPVLITQLASELGKPMHLINQVIVELELAGCAERRLGNMVCIKS